MARGTTTMKMISSTSTTSTSGVTLISDCRPAPGAPPCSCMTSVPLRLRAGALGDPSHVLEAGLLDGDHGLPHVSEVQPGVPLDHDLGVRHAPRGQAEAVREAIGGDLLIVDPEETGLVDGDQ